MRKKIFGKQFARNRKSRNALFYGLIKEVIEHGSVVTTHTKALAIRPELEKLMRLVSDESIAAKRIAASTLRNDRELIAKLFGYSTLSRSRVSGYTTIAKLPNRRGDNASVTRISWIQSAASTESAGEAKKSDKQQVTSVA